MNEMQVNEPEGVGVEVPAANRSVQILDFIATCEEPPTVVAVARALNLAKSSTHGLCATLIKRGIIEKRGQGLVIAGHVMLWANSFMARSDMAAEFLRLVEETPELRMQNVTLTIRDGADVVYIASRHGGESTGLVYRVGHRAPAAFSAAGKAMLSTLSDYDLQELYRDGFPAPLTPHSVKTVEALVREVEEIRALGYSRSIGQVAEQLSCVGAAVFDFTGKRAVGGMSLSVPTPLMTEEKGRELSERLLRNASLLSHRLGFHLPYIVK
jgi:DNA-binding IclR family transcriptional regulator